MMKRVKYIIVFAIALGTSVITSAQVPNISYTTASNVYNDGFVINPLIPTNTGGVIAENSIVSTLPYTVSSGVNTSINSLTGIAMDLLGNIYISDEGQHIIQKISTTGILTILAGSGVSGFADGTGTSAKFNRPKGLAVDKSGNVYVADMGNNRIRKISSTGVVSTLAGSGVGGSVNATGALASFYNPTGIAIDKSGNLYVAEFVNNMIRKISPAGVVTLYAGVGSSGAIDGPSTSASFNHPYGIAIDSLDNLYIADASNNKIRKINSAGIVSTLAGSGNIGSTDGIGTSASFSFPYGVAINKYGNLYVADRANKKIREISPSGKVTTLAGNGLNGNTNGIGSVASFGTPEFIVIDSLNNLLITDGVNRQIRKCNPICYSISPSLPTGLYLNPITGVINGTPVEVIAATNYTIKVSNSSGIDSTVISISVKSSAFTNNANLSSLTLSSGSLSASFSSIVHNYSSIINSIPTKVTITPVSMFATSTISVRVNTGSYVTVQSGVASSLLLLNNLKNTIDIKVTALNGTIGTYTINVNKHISKNAKLKNLLTSVGTYTPVFDSTISWYDETVTSIIDSISIKADLADTTAKMSGFSNGIFSNNIPLAYGYNPIAIVVTAEDSVTQNIYGINILRQELAPVVTYPFSQGIFYVNKKTPTVIPTNLSDSADNYSISPNLPKGLVLSTVNGRITGTPTDTSSMKTYQIIAQNFGGADTILIDIEVQYPEPVISRVSKDSVCYGDSIIIYGKYFNWVKKEIGRAHV